MVINNWMTYDGRVVAMENMDHQHMSNIHHFINLIVPQYYSQGVRAEILFWLTKRFNGIILPYHPVPDFKQEKTYLQAKGYLQPNNDVVVNGKKIGCYE